MDRRSVVRSLAGAAIVLLGGCLGEEMSGGFSPEESDDETEGGGADENEGGLLSDEIEALQEQFDEQGLNVLDVDVTDAFIVFDVQTTGDIDEDVRVASGAYATLSAELERDLRVRIEDRGLHQETFEIELEWARQFVEGRLSDEEYLEQIEETR